MNFLKSFAWFITSLSVLSGFIFLWQLIADLGFVSRAFLPGPDRVWIKLTAGFASGEMLSESWQTIVRMFYGWVLASMIGVFLGSIIGISTFAKIYIAPMLEVIRPLPASAIAPVAIVFLGMTDEMVLVLIAFGSMWPMLLTTTHGFSNVHPRLLEVSQIMGFGRWKYIYKFALPSALPDILGGLRLGLTVALILAVVGEMLTVQGGLGSRILLAARGFRSADIFAGVILLGLIGLFSNLILTYMERYTLRWRPR